MQLKTLKKSSNSTIKKKRMEKELILKIWTSFLQEGSRLLLLLKGEYFR